MANLRPFISLFFFLYNVGACFHLPSRRRIRRRSDRFRARLATSKTTVLQFIKHLFSSASKSAPPQSPLMPAFTNSRPNSSPPSRPGGNIHPCSVCGEIFQSPDLLDHHHSTTHHIADVFEGENIVQIIFRTGWPEPTRPPTVHRILKIHNHPKIVARFEEHRESVKSRAAAARSGCVRDERCVADGNELLRFYCTTYVCDLDASVCSHPYCSLCGIIRGGFSPKMDGTPTQPTGHAAHMSLPAEVEEEFRFMHVRRAMLVCRVIAGRVGCGSGRDEKGFDSLTGGGSDDEDELLLFNPRAVLPCFVILYTTL